MQSNIEVRSRVKFRARFFKAYGQNFSFTYKNQAHVLKNQNESVIANLSRFTHIVRTMENGLRINIEKSGENSFLVFQ